MAKNITYNMSEAYQIGYADGEKDMLDKCHKWVLEQCGSMISLEMLEAMGGPK